MLAGGLSQDYRPGRASLTGSVDMSCSKRPERVFGITIDELVRKPISAAEGGAVSNRALL